MAGERSVAWMSFCSSGTLTRTIVHFFPSAGGASAPYPAHCRLSLFGHGEAPKSVLLEGARLGQADGVWVDDAFPALRSGNGLYGLAVELSTPQPRVDLSPSGCAIEFHSALHLSRFWPTGVSKQGIAERRGPLPLVRDPFHTTSIIVVNGNAQPSSPRFSTSRVHENGEVLVEPLEVGTVQPYSVTETQVPTAFFDSIPAQECSFGLLRSGAIALVGESDPEVVCSVLYRDASTGQPISVCSL